MWTLAVQNSDELIHLFSIWTTRMSFMDIFPGLSRSCNFQEKNPGLSRRRVNPGTGTRASQAITSTNRKHFSNSRV